MIYKDIGEYWKGNSVNIESGHDYFFIIFKYPNPKKGLGEQKTFFFLTMI